MRLPLTVVDGAAGASYDVVLDADPRTPVADVLPALVRAAGGGTHPGFLRRAAVWVDGVRADDDATLRGAGVRAGSVVALHEAAGSSGLPQGVVELRVVSGPGAGRVQLLGLGDHQVGGGASGMSLPDVLLPADALTLRVGVDGVVTLVEHAVEVEVRAAPVVDGGSADTHADTAGDPEADTADDPDGPATDEELDLLPLSVLSRRERRRRRRREKARAEAERRAAEEPAPPTWPEGADLRLGQTLLQWHRPWRPDADAVPARDRLGLDVNRPPRLLRPPRELAFVLPAEPRPPRRVQIPWPMVVAPVLMAGPMALLFGSYRFLVFAALSPLLAFFNYFSQRRGSARDHREALVAHRRELRSVHRRLAAARRAEREDLRVDHPDPAALLLQARGPGQQLWARRRSDPDHLVVRLGVADRPSRLEVRDRARKETDAPRPPDQLADVPVSLSLRDVPVVGACGEAAARDATARWVVGQAAVLHSPRDLQVVVLTARDRGEQWGWVRWLPHCRRDGEPVGALVGTDQDSTGRRVAELLHLVEQRRGEAGPLGVRGGSGGPARTPAPDVLVVLDGARRLRELPGVVALLRDGPAVGVHLLCLDDDRRSLPEECGAVLEVQEGMVELQRTGSESVARIRPDLVEPSWATLVARSLAGLRDATPDERTTTLPSSARLLELVDLPDPAPELVAARWGPEARTDVVIGAGFDGAFRLDLRRDGPHALVAGTTGSGKSELLQTLVASLALANTPDQLTFVLVDYKGGSAFKDCARLPHTVGMVTDLDTHLVGRALTSLGAELRRREHLLAVPGAKDLEDYWALQRRPDGADLPTIPRLAIVIDEFASLKAELPDFVSGLVTIAQRGRSLGIHLVLATQRPSGVVSADIRANTNLRIALRVTDESESRDVIDAPESATIGADQPGRGYARLGHSSLLPFQAGRVGGARPGAAADPSLLPEPLAWTVPWDRLGQPVPPRPGDAGPATDEGETDLSVLVGAVRGATALRRLPPPASPWLPPLPAPVTVGDLQERYAAPAPVPGAVTGITAAWALEDHPAEQAQRPRTFTLGRSGHLFVVGGPRSGRSTALRTLAAGLAAATTSRDLHLHALDCGGGALLPLTALPHTGAVVQRTEVERAGRLLDRLAAEVKHRQDVLGRSGFADVDEQRAAAPPAERLPYVVLLLDRYEGFLSDLADVDVGRLQDRLLSLLREGASVGVHVVVSGDRSLLTGRVAATVESKLLLRLPDRGDYTSAGLRARDVPDDLADGRGLWSEVGTEAQVAVLGPPTADGAAPDVSGAAQAAAVRALGERLGAAERDLPPAPAALRPVRLAALPAEVLADDVLGGDGSSYDALPAGWVPLAVGGDELALLGAEATTSPVLVLGPPRSGRTTTLRFLARWAASTGRPVLGFAPSGGALADELGGDAVVGADADAAAVVERVRALPDGALVLVDDGELLKDGPLAPVLLAIVRQGRDRGFSTVVAGGTAELSSGFSGWAVEARKGRKGLLLSPQEALQADVFGGRVARTSLVTRVAPGRGVLFAGDGDQVVVQVPLVR